MTEYDAAIVGGGLGGLSLSILLAKQGWRVVLFEKEHYPFHRVCGEYISNESREFVEALGLDLSGIGVAEISKLSVNSPKGKEIRSELGLGGFGVSRYAMDHALADLAKAAGVDVLEGNKVQKVSFSGGEFVLESSKTTCKSRFVAGSFGKKSNMDRELQRPFSLEKPSPAHNYVGVKYHVSNPDFPSDLIELSNFKDGYCGMSKVEGDRFCMCYLTTAKSLQDNGNSIEALEENVLMQNPILADRFRHSTRLDGFPVVISNVTFRAKSPVASHILMLGDGAGTIAPLCGNGMSMAFHAAWTMSGMAGAFLAGKIEREAMERDYSNWWKKEFSRRIRVGRQLQKLFGKVILTEIAFTTLKPFPRLVRRMVRFTHGDPFFTRYH